MAFSGFGWQKSYSLCMFRIFFVDNTVLGVTTGSKEKKTGYYLCKKLSKHSTAKWWILHFVKLCYTVHWLMTIFVFLIKGTPSPLESVYIFQTPPFYLQFSLGTHQFLISPPPPPNMFVWMLSHYNQSFSDVYWSFPLSFTFSCLREWNRLLLIKIFKQRVHGMVF